MRSVVIADTEKHAEAMIKWLKLNPRKWHAVAYGEKIREVYESCKLVRPSKGIQQVHFDWVLEQLVPNLCLSAEPIPPIWHLAEPKKEGPQMAENALWA
jgi:hypothetical protein